MKTNLTDPHPAGEFRLVRQIALPSVGRGREIRIALCPDRSSISIRMFQCRRPGARWRPQPAGFRVPAELIPQLIAALEMAQASLREDR